jgi:hypothetical protein
MMDSTTSDPEIEPLVPVMPNPARTDGGRRSQRSPVRDDPEAPLVPDCS